MNVDQDHPESLAMNKASTEQRKSFDKALQELKNLRPQLYCAAEFYENSYQISKQKPMVIDNLKGYVARAVVNAVDHIGTVAYKLSDILEQQTSDISTMELKATCLDQQLRSCQTYVDNEGLRQQRLLATNRRHHKHYTLPASALRSVNTKVQSSSHAQKSPKKHVQKTRRLFLPGAPAAKTLSWHLASEAKSKLKRASQTFMSGEKAKSSGRTSGASNALANESNKTETSAPRPRPLRAGPATSVAMQTLGIIQQDGYKPLSPFRSFGNTHRKKMNAPVRSKSAVSAFFVKHRTNKLKTRP